ncbi:MAG TPA: MFS transporter [Streptosporangiaceae bacterium]|jgi:FSR family fosmidomycin resistance protein-like MFS transporter
MQRGRLALLTGTHIVDDFYQGAVPAILPFLVLERQYSYAAATGITLAATFLSSLVQPAFGVLTDRHRMRWLVGVGLLVAGIGIGLAGLTHSYALTWLAVAVSGIGVAAYHPEATRSAREAAGWSAQGMSLFAVGGNGGIAIAPVVVTPILAATGLGGTPLLVIPAAAMALALAVLARRARTANAARPKAAVPEETRTDDWRRFGWLTGVVICRSVAYFGVSTFIALYLIRNFGASKAIGSAALTTFMAVGACGTVIGGGLADRIGRLPTVRIGYALAVPGILALLFAPSVPVVFAGAVLAGLGLYVPFAVHTTLGQEYLPNRLGTASGVTIGLAVSVGGMLAPVLGWLADSHGIRAVLVVLLAPPLLALLLSTRLRDTLVRKPVAARR